MIKKRLLYTVICMLFFLAVSVSGVIAIEEKNETPRLQMSLLNTYINQVKTSLNISENGTSIVYGYANKTLEGNEIYLSSILQRNINGVWSNLESWFVCTTLSTAIINEIYHVSHGKYRVETNYYISGYDGGYESGTIYSDIEMY